MNVTPDAANQIKLIDDGQVNAWLHLCHCTTLTDACLLHQAGVALPSGGYPVRPKTSLAGYNRGYLNPGQFDVAKFCIHPDSDPDVQDNFRHRAKHREAFPRSNSGWQKRIRSNDRKVIRFEDHSRELISRACVKPGAGNIVSYAEQDVQTLLFPRCEVPHMEIEVGFFWGLFVPGRVLEILDGFSFVLHTFFLLCFAFICFQLWRFLGLVCARLRPLCTFG